MVILGLFVIDQKYTECTSRRTHVISQHKARAAIKNRCQDVGFRSTNGRLPARGVGCWFCGGKLPDEKHGLIPANRGLLLTFKDTNERGETSKNFLISGPDGRSPD